TRAERLDRLRWGLGRTRDLGLNTLTLHAGFIPAPGDPARKGVLDTLVEVGRLALAEGVTVAFETGQESADVLRLTLDELACPNLGVNFDPANVLLYGNGDPIRALDILVAYVRGVHAKDALLPARPGEWGQEVPLGTGNVDFPRLLALLAQSGYRGP